MSRRVWRWKCRRSCRLHRAPELETSGAPTRAGASDRRLRVALIFDTVSGEIGGSELNTAQFARALRDAGHQPVLMEVGPRAIMSALASEGLELRHQATADFKHVPLETWRSLLGELRPDVVVRSKNWVERSNLSLDLAVLLQGIPYLGWEHHQAKPFKSSARRFPLVPTIGRWKIEKFLHARAVRRTVAVSAAVKAPMVDRYLFAESSVDVIHPGVDFGSFRFSADDRARVRGEWDLPANAIVVGSVGRLAPSKRNDFVLEVVAGVRSGSPELPVYCVLAGKGPDLARLVEHARALGIHDRVRLPGWQSDIAAAWSGIDVMLLPSEEEGLGMTLIEAVACGAIPVAAAVGGMKEVMTGTLAPFSLPPGDLPVWISTVGSLLHRSPAERRRLNDDALAELKGRFDGTTQWVAMVRWLERHAGA